MLTPEFIRSNTLRSFLLLNNKTVQVLQEEELATFDFYGQDYYKNFYLIYLNVNKLTKALVHNAYNFLPIRYAINVNDHLVNNTILVYRRDGCNFIVIANNSNPDLFTRDLNDLLYNFNRYVYVYEQNSELKTNLELSLTLNLDQIHSYIEKQRIEKLHTATEKIPNAKISQLEKLSKQYLSSIDELSEQINGLKQKYRETMQKLLYERTEPSENHVARFVKFLERCKYVTEYIFSFSESFNYVTIYVNTNWMPIDYTYEDSRADKLVLENPDFVNNQNKHILLDAIAKRERYVIMHRPVQFTFNWKLSDKINYNIYIASLINRIKINNTDTGNTLFRNEHWFRYNCLGSFSSDLAIAQDDKDLTRLMMILLQYLQTINIADYAGTSWLKQTHIIYDKEEQTYYSYNPINGDMTESFFDINKTYKACSFNQSSSDNIFYIKKGQD